MKAKVIANNEDLINWELSDEMKTGDVICCYDDKTDPDYFISENGYSIPSSFVEII